MWNEFQETISFMFWTSFIFACGVVISMFVGGDEGGGDDTNDYYGEDDDIYY